MQPMLHGWRLQSHLQKVLADNGLDCSRAGRQQMSCQAGQLLHQHLCCWRKLQPLLAQRSRQVAGHVQQHAHICLCQLRRRQPAMLLSSQLKHHAGLVSMSAAAAAAGVRHKDMLAALLGRTHDGGTAQGMAFMALVLQDARLETSLQSRSGGTCLRIWHQTEDRCCRWRGCTSRAERNRHR